MSEMKCTCGGKYISLGREFLRVGEIESGAVLLGASRNSWTEETIPGELFACLDCCAVKFCADREWIEQRLARKRAEENRPRTEEEKQAARWETVVQSYMKDFAGYKEEKLEKILQGKTFVKYSDEAVEAARRTLQQMQSG